MPTASGVVGANPGAGAQCRSQPHRRDRGGRRFAVEHECSTRGVGDLGDL